MSHNILIVGPAWVGDMVMAQCLFKLLKREQSGVTIDVLAPSSSLPLLSRMPEVANTIVMPLGHGRMGFLERYRLGKTLRNHKYDQAIVLPNSWKSALIPWFARIPVRTGWRGEMRYGLLNDCRVLDKKRYPLMIERFMALGLLPDTTIATPYPIPSLQTSHDEQVKALSKHQLSVNAPIVALCPGAEFGPAKRWPEEHYAAVAKAKIAEGWIVWILGSPKDNEVAEKIKQLAGERCINLAGKTTLEEAIDLLALSTSVITNDSGLMHIAAALHKPLIALYGPTSPAFTPPLDEHAKILSLKLDCQPCFKRVCPLGHHKCMVELEPQPVIDIVSKSCV
jgi:heptosyltransferase-2